MVHSIQQEHLTDEQKQIITNSHVVFGMPCFGGMLSTDTFHAMLDFTGFWSKCGLTWSVETLSNESLVTRARNILVAKMMARKEATHLMFIDADIGFHTSDVIRLLAHDVDVVAGLYPKKSYPIEYVLNTLPDQLSRSAEIAEVVEIGTGFMMIKRAVIEKMFEAYPQYHCPTMGELPERERPHTYALFDTEIVNSNYLSEDYAFCRRWRAIGGRIYADTRIQLSHSGFHTFQGDPRSVLPFVD